MNVDFRRLIILVLAFLSWNTRIWDWIWSRWRRMILYIVAWHMIKMHKQTNMRVKIKASRTCLSQNWVLAANAVTAKMATRIQTTLADVTMLGYCNGLTMAMSLSMLFPIIMNSEAPHRDNPIVWYVFSNIFLRSSDRENDSIKFPAMKSGWAIKPTQRSEDARPQSNRMDGERRAGVFHTAHKTNAFPVIATKARGMFTTQLAIMMNCSTAIPVIFQCFISTYQLRLWCATFNSFQRLCFLQKTQLISLPFRSAGLALDCSIIWSTAFTQLKLVTN